MRWVVYHKPLEARSRLEPRQDDGGGDDGDDGDGDVNAAGRAAPCRDGDLKTIERFVCQSTAILHAHRSSTAESRRSFG